MFSNYIYREGLINSFAIAGVTTFFVFLIAFPLALLYDRYDFPGKNLTHLFVMIPMILPPFVGALGFQQILGHYGVVNTILTGCGLRRSISSAAAAGSGRSASSKRCICTRSSI